ncbi:MAG: gliding motility protein GldL, partial [Bacteroidota bacterium]
MKTSEIIQTRGWKVFMQKLYSWGASVVLAGALFKIMHWPGASIMLVIGMGAEVIIFFFSAFEPLHEELDWTLVFPELAGIEEETGSRAIKPTGEGLQKLEAMMEGLNVNSSMFENLGNGLNRLSETTANLSDLSDATVATTDFAQNVQLASESVSGLNDTFVKSNEELNQSVQELSGSYQNAAEAISSSGNEAAAKFKESGNELTSIYQQLADSIKDSANTISGESNTYGGKIEEINKNLTA